MEYLLSFNEAAHRGNLDKCKYIINQNKTVDLNQALIASATGGHLDLCKYLINQGANSYNYAFKYAAQEGYIKVCEYLSMYNVSPRDALPGVAYRGNLEMCKYLIDLGADTYTSALQHAAEAGRLEMCVLLVSYVDNIDYALCGAVANGHLDVCKYLFFCLKKSLIFCLKISNATKMASEYCRDLRMYKYLIQQSGIINEQSEIIKKIMYLF